MLSLKSAGTVGSRQSAFRQSAVGSRQSAVGSRQSAVGSRQSAVGSRQSAVGSRQSAVGSRQSAVGVKVKVKRQGKGRANSCMIFSHQHCMVLFVPLQVVTLVAPCANAAVIRILLGCQNWILHLRAVDFCHAQVNTEYRCLCL